MDRGVTDKWRQTPEAARRPAARGLAVLLAAHTAILAGPVLLAATGCRYQDMNARGELGAAPFADLECFEPGNPEGFSFEVPACECSAGMRLRYFARLAPSPSDIHYEFETGFRDGDPSDDVRMVSRSRDHLDHLFIGGRELPAYDDASPADRAQWDLARPSFAEMMRNYGPVLDHGFQVCAEDRVDAEAKARTRAAR
ncbi:MAG: hypothetical protein HY905_26460 [Deltaproteobacteria bacterium]|nr:hypothetical protein [Deltaproteobacteria bacterium]